MGALVEGAAAGAVIEGDGFGAGAGAGAGAATVVEAADEVWLSAGWPDGFEAGSSGQYPSLLACVGAHAKPFLSRYDVGTRAAALVLSGAALAFAAWVAVTATFGMTLPVGCPASAPMPARTTSAPAIIAVTRIAVLWLLRGGPARGSTDGPAGGTGGNSVVSILILFLWSVHQCGLTCGR